MKRARGRRRDFWRSAQWPLFWGLALVSVALGYAGFARYYRAPNAQESWSDLLYYSLQLFPLQSGALTRPLNWQLEVARLLAPLLTIYALAITLAQLFRAQLQLLRVRWYRGHVVICGLGRKGALLAGAFRERGQRVVAIELDEGSDHVEPTRALGVDVFLGDATDPLLLRRAGGARARQVLALTGSDEVNAEVAVRVRALASEDDGGGPLTCVVHAFDTEIWALLREQELAGGGPERFQLHTFNVFESGAAAMLAAAPWRVGAPPHLLVVGLGQLGESVVLQAAGGRPADAPRLRVTVVDREAKRKCSSLALRVPHLARGCDLEPLEADARAPEERPAFAFDPAGRCTLAAAYVCLDDDAAALAAGLALHRGLRGCDVPIVVRMEEESGLATLITGSHREGGRFEQLLGFGLLERTCQPERLLGVSRETLARALHDAYRDERRQAGDTPATNPALVPWDELDDEVRASNLRQAGDVGRKLQAIGCELRALRGVRATPYVLAAAEVELLARLEHARWLQEKQSLGWTYAPGARDHERRTNPYMLPWAELDEATRESNRRAAREMPAFLAGLGFEVRRVPARAGARPETA